MAQLKYNGIINRGYGEQVKLNAQDISEIKEELATLEPVEQIIITGTSGTITSEQLNTLQANEQNQIVCDGEIFRLMDNMAESGYLVYGHVGAISSKQTVKTITITLSTRSWVLQSSTIESGGGLKLNKYTSSTTVPVPDDWLTSIYRVTISGTQWGTIKYGGYTFYKYITLNYESEQMCYSGQCVFVNGSRSYEYPMFYVSAY